MSKKIVLVWSDDQYSEILLNDLLKQNETNGCYIQILYFLHDTGKSSIAKINSQSRNGDYNGDYMVVESVCCELNYPANNFTKLAIAVNIADEWCCNQVEFAIHKENCYGTPQDRMLFLKSLNHAASFGTKNNVCIYTPYLDLTPTEIYEKLEIGKNEKN